MNPINFVAPEINFRIPIIRSMPEEAKSLDIGWLDVVLEPSVIPTATDKPRFLPHLTGFDAPADCPYSVSGSLRQTSQRLYIS